jgi:hypothetical protein
MHDMHDMFALRHGARDDSPITLALRPHPRTLPPFLVYQRLSSEGMVDDVPCNRVRALATHPRRERYSRMTDQKNQLASLCAAWRSGD